MRHIRHLRPQQTPATHRNAWLECLIVSQFFVEKKELFFMIIIYSLENHPADNEDSMYYTVFHNTRVQVKK